jgi:hypothetical protein
VSNDSSDTAYHDDFDTGEDDDEENDNEIDERLYEQYTGV